MATQRYSVTPPPEKRERLQPVSVYPLTFEQALKALVSVKPKGRA